MAVVNDLMISIALKYKSFDNIISKKDLVFNTIF